MEKKLKKTKYLIGIASILLLATGWYVAPKFHVKTTETAVVVQISESDAYVTKLAPDFKWKARYLSAITEASEKYGVPQEILIAVTEVESGFNPQARGTHGERGLFQLKPATAKYICQKLDMYYYDGIEFSIYDSVLVAAAYLNYLHTKYENKGINDSKWYYALVAYNKGEGSEFIRPKDSKYVKNVSATLSKKPIVPAETGVTSGNE